MSLAATLRAAAWPLAASLVIHVALLLYAAHVDAHPERFGGLRYTDVDWSVVADGLAFMARPAPEARATGWAAAWLRRAWGWDIGSLTGARPYRRATFRYTPLLPLALAPTLVSPLLGKLVLVIASLLVPVLVMHPTLSASAGVAAAAPSARLTHAVWTLNPLVINITTRGSPEAFICLLVAALHLALRQAAAADGAPPPAAASATVPVRPPPRDTRRRQRWQDAGAVLLALATSYKIFPAIYAVPTYLVLARHLGYMSPAVLRFALLGLATTLLVNGALWSVWGDEFLEHTFLYHLHRKDHRHNFSPYFLPIYLSYFPSSSTASTWLPRLGTSGWAAHVASALDAALAASRHPLASFAPQASLVLLAGLVEPTLGLAASMFLQTAMFVVFNKVCTSQYYLWPLPLVPHLATSLSRRQTATALALWVAGQGAWLGTAYRLEFLGEAVHVRLWLAGLALFGASVWGLGQLVDGLERRARAAAASVRIKTE